MAVAEDLEAERRRQQAHWQQRLEREQIETERASRQYSAVESENRLVARTLEKKWEGLWLLKRNSKANTVNFWPSNQRY